MVTVRIRLHQLANGSTGPRYGLLHFIVKTNILSGLNYLSFIWDKCFHLIGTDGVQFAQKNQVSSFNSIKVGTSSSLKIVTIFQKLSGAWTRHRTKASSEKFQQGFLSFHSPDIPSQAWSWHPRHRPCSWSRRQSWPACVDPEWEKWSSFF